MQLHWFWFNTIAIVHCDNNENWINTQIIASGLSLVITPTFVEYKWISAAATFVIYCRQLPQKNSTDLEEPGKPEMQLWFALARRLLLPTQTGDKECSISAICLFFHIYRRLSASRGKQPRQISSPLFPLERLWWWVALPHCIFSLFLVSLSAKHEAVENELFIKSIFTLVMCVLHMFIHILIRC